MRFGEKCLSKKNIRLKVAGNEVSISKERREVLLQEYVQGNMMVRHNVKTCWTIFAIFFPLSFGLLGLSYTIREVTVGSLIILAAASIALYLVWILVDRRFTWYTRIHFKRIHEIEAILNMRLHREIDYRDKGRVQDPDRALPIRRFLYKSVIVLLILWILRIAIFS